MTKATYVPALWWLAIGAIMVLIAGRLQADTIVFANRTDKPVTFTVLRSGNVAENMQLEPAGA